jgi:hypothetical protein
MQPVSIRIHFGRPDRTYAPGKAVRGTIVVRAREACRCKHLYLFRVRTTRVRGQRHTSYRPTITLARRQTWAAGTVHTYPFEFVASNAFT